MSSITPFSAPCLAVSALLTAVSFSSPVQAQTMTSSTASVSQSITASTAAAPTVQPDVPALTPEEELLLEEEYGDIRSIDTVIITADAEEVSKVAGSAHKVTEKELERFEYDDIQRVLTKVSGVYVRDEDGFGLRPNIGMRGVSSERSAKVVLMEDGILLAPAPYSAPPAYFTPLATRMINVEIFKGPSSIQNGPYTVGGAVNYVTAEIPNSHQAMIDVAAGQFDYSKLHGRWGYGEKHWGLLLEGVRLSSSGFKELDGGGNTGFEKHEAMLKARYNTNPDGEYFHRFDIKLGYADEVSNETYLGLSNSDFAANPYRRYRASALGLMEWERTQMQLSYGLWAGDSFELNLTAYRHDYSRAWRKFNNFGTFDSGALQTFDV